MKYAILIIALGILLIPSVLATTTLIVPSPWQNFTFGNLDFKITTTLPDPVTLDCWLSKGNSTPTQIVNSKSILLNGTKTFNITITTSLLNYAMNYNLSCMLDNLNTERFEVFPFTICDPVGCYQGQSMQAINSQLISSNNRYLSTLVSVETPIHVDCTNLSDKKCKKLYKKAVKAYLKDIKKHTKNK